MKKTLFVAAVAGTCGAALAQSASVAHAPGQPVWVFFADKGFESARAESEAIAGLESAADARQVQRRQLRRTDPGLFDARDLPIASRYAEAVAATGAHARTESRWANAISVVADAEQLRTIAGLPFVRAVQPVRGTRPVPCIDLEADSGGYSQRLAYGRSGDQLTQMNLPAMHDRGYTGAGVIVGILDTGFSRIHDVFNNPAHLPHILAEHDFINNDDNTGIEASDPAGQHEHGTLILSCLASYLPGEMIGGAFDASFILCKTEVVPTETQIEEDYYAAAIEYCEARGVDVTTSSLGYIDWYTQADLNGHTAVTTIALNTAAANGVHCCTAAGNEGHDADAATSHLIAPADGLKVLTCGAVNNLGVEASFTSDGPTADGRVKPELLACGRRTACVDPNSPTAFATASGTSLSTPLLAATVACMTQAHPDWTVDQMRANLFATASDQVANGAPDPLFVRGYGIVNALAAHQRDCAADFNQDGGIDGADVQAFFESWGGGDPSGDVNKDGGVDGGDVEAFFVVWTAGGC